MLFPYYSISKSEGKRGDATSPKNGINTPLTTPAADEDRPRISGSPPFFVGSFETKRAPVIRQDCIQSRGAVGGKARTTTPRFHPTERDPSCNDIRDETKRLLFCCVRLCAAILLQLFVPIDLWKPERPLDWLSARFRLLSACFHQTYRWFSLSFCSENSPPYLSAACLFDWIVCLCACVVSSV